MTASGIWVTLALVCMIGQTMCEVKHLYEAKAEDAKQEITLEHLIDKLRYQFDLDAGAKNEFKSRKLASQVYNELARTSEKDEPSRGLMGHSVNELLKLSTWNAETWTEKEFNRRVRICFDLVQPRVVDEIDPYKKSRWDDVMKINLGVYCWVSSYGVFSGVITDLAEKALPKVAGYKEALEEFNDQIFAAIDKTNSNQSIWREMATEKLLTNMKQEKLAEIKKMCSEVLEEFGPAFAHGQYVPAKYSRWQSLHGHCVRADTIIKRLKL